MGVDEKFGGSSVCLIYGKRDKVELASTRVVSKGMYGGRNRVSCGKSVVR